MHCSVRARAKIKEMNLAEGMDASTVESSATNAMIVGSCTPKNAMHQRTKKKKTKAQAFVPQHSLQDVKTNHLKLL